MRSWVTLCSLSALLLGAAGSARAGFTTVKTTPYPGVTHAVYTDASVPLVVHVVTVDISSQEIFLSSTLTGDRGQTLSDWADCKRGTSGCTPIDVAMSRNSQFLYALTAGSHAISAFGVRQNDGSLSTTQGAGGLPVGTVGLAAQ